MFSLKGKYAKIISLRQFYNNLLNIIEISMRRVKLMIKHALTYIKKT